VRELVEQWLEKAETDLVAAGRLASEARLRGLAAFLCQQAAENFLKAVLVRNQVEFPKIHNLKEILDLVATVEPLLAAALRPAEVLTEYAVDPRYPGDYPKVTSETVRTALAVASQVREAVRRNLRDYPAP